MDENLEIRRERVNVRVYFLMIGFAVLGISALFISAYLENRHHIWCAVTRELGVTLLVAAALTLAWDIVGRRTFTDEILAKANMSRDLADAGILLVADNFRDPRIQWENLLKNSCTLDIWVAYASTWRNSNLDAIKRLLSRKDSRLRVVLPDPDNELLTKELAGRFEMAESEVREKILEAIAGFENCRKYGTVELRLLNRSPLFTVYVFTSKAVLAFYNHRKGREPVPTFLCDEDGFLFGYLKAEFDHIFESAKAREIPSDVSARA